MFKQRVIQNLNLGSLILDSRFWFWVLDLESQVLGIKLKIPSLCYRSHSVITKKCYKKFLQRRIGSTKCDSFSRVWQKIIKSVTGITKCDKSITKQDRNLLQSVTKYYKPRRNKADNP